jgi:predicted acyl esterase
VPNMTIRIAIASAVTLVAVVLPGTAAAAAPSLPGLLACGYYPDVQICSGQVPSFDGSPLDVDLTMPTQPSSGRHPLIVMLHGFGNNKREWESVDDEGDGADKYHWNNHWFAEHGYYVLTYTARGFPTGSFTGAYQPGTPGGTSLSLPNGTIHVKSRDFEIRDTQWLAALVAAGYPAVDPQSVAVTGGSYGGGESWLQASQATWSFPQSVDASLPVLQLQVSVPKYPWTDIGYSFLPNGHGGGPSGQDIYESAFGRPPNEFGIGNPLGTLKLSWLVLFTQFIAPSRGGVFEQGTTVTPSEEGPQNLQTQFNRLLAGDPYDVAGLEDPVVAQYRRGATRFRSAYYQLSNWQAQTTRREVAIFSISGWTDDLFPPVESFRMFKLLKRLDSRWPVAVAIADVGHARAQNKPATWHRLNHQAWQFLQAQINGSHRQQTTVYSEPTTCANDGDADNDLNASHRLTATTPEGLGHGTLTVRYSRPGALNYAAGALDPNGASTDPVAAYTSLVPACRVAVPTPALPGGAVYTATSEPLGHPETYVGLGEIDVQYQLAGSTASLDARVWDVAPDGTTLLVTRGTYRIDTPLYDSALGTLRLPLFGNQWTFERGHSVRIDLTQADYPFLRPSNVPSAVGFAPPTLVLPTRDASDDALSGN